MTKQVYLTKRVKFSAAHFFHLEHLSPQENFARFGPSSNKNAHGHNYTVEVTIKGPCDPDTGMVINLKDIKPILEKEVVEPMNFKNLNLDVPYFKTRFPTLENLSLMLWEKLTPHINAFNLTLAHIKIAEDDDLYVEYTGP